MIDLVQAFHDAWRVAATHQISERPDAAIRRALRSLALGVASRAARGETEEGALRPFQAAVARPDATSSDPSTLQAHVLRDGDRMLIDVAIGSAAGVFAFDRNGKELAVPSILAWSPTYTGPFRRLGRLILHDAESIQDAGVRYGYRLDFLRRTPQGYASAGTAKGTWTYDERTSTHFAVQGRRVTVNTLDAPRAFFVSSPERILRRVDVWDASGTTARRIRSTRLDDDLRAVDAWLAGHVGTRVQGGFTVKKDAFADDIRRERGGISLDLDGTVLRFTLARRRGGYVVQSVRAGR